MKLYSVLLFAALCASCAEDDGGQTPGDSFREPVPETITLDDAVVTYYGDDSYSGVSDLWTLDLAQSSAGQRLSSPKFCKTGAKKNKKKRTNADFLLIFVRRQPAFC